jgi:AAA domain (dynein-related subfamily)
MATAAAQPQVIPSLNTDGIIELVTKAVPKRRPVLIAGAPGIGKTQIVRQVARNLGYDLIVSHPAISDPTDFKGLPWFDAKSKSASFFPIGECEQAFSATRPTLWFFDDIAQAPETVQASTMHLFEEEGSIGNHVLPECVSLIGATNGRQHRAGARGLLEPVKSRFTTIVELIPDYVSWRRWAVQQAHIPSMLIAYLGFCPERLNQFSPSADLTNSPSLRTWEHVAQIEELGLSEEVESVSIAGAVGTEAASEYLAFRKLHASLVNVDDILTRPDKAAIPHNPSELYAVSIALAGRTNKQNFPQVAKYIKRMADAKHGEFAVLTVRSATDRDTTLITTDTYVRLQGTEIGDLITGTIRN